MISILKNAQKEKKLTREQEKELYKPKDVIVTRIITLEEQTKEGLLIKRIEKKVNLSKMANETKKVIKAQNATSTIEKITSIQKELLNKGVL